MFRAAAVLALVSALLTSRAASAQQSASAGMIGHVRDATGAGLPGATVTVTNAVTGARRTAATDEQGRFSIPGLPAASYALRADLPGFRSTEIAALTLHDGEMARPALVLLVAGVAERVSVQAEAPRLQRAGASVGSLIDERMLQELPIAGRMLLNVVATAPGVSGRNFQRSTQYGRRDQYVTVEGGRDTSTNYVIDGVYVRSLRANNMSVNLPIDSVHQIQLLRNAYPSEYGQGQSIVSIVTRSGTNGFAGTAAGYLRDDALNARNYFAATTPQHDKRLGGATAGGPLWRNRVFAFGSYEANRERKGEVQIATAIVDTRWLTGDFSGALATIRDPLTGQPFPGNRIPADRISRFAALQNDRVPLANQPGATNNYRVVKHFTDDTDTVMVRLDENLAPSHTLFQRYLWYDSMQVLPGAVTQLGRPQRGANLALGHTWVISPSVVSELRFGYNHAFHIGSNVLEDEAIGARNWVADAGLRNLQGGLSSAYFGRPGATISGVTGPPATGVVQGATDDVFSVSNALSKVVGGHTLRFGVQAQFRKFYQTTPVSPRGAFTFNGAATGTANNVANAFADYLLGYCSACTGQFGTTDANYRSATWAPFVDDVWAVTGRLTIQAGLRWEYLAPWHEIDDLEASLDPASGKIAFHTVPDSLPPALLPLVDTRANVFPKGITKKDLDNFAPRVGVAYSLDERTVLRTGVGIYYDNLNLNELQFTRLVPPFAGRYDLSPSGRDLVNVADLFPDLNAVATFPAPFSMNPDNRTAFSRHWNASLQRLFGREYVFEVAYTGSQSRHGYKRYNLNQPREGTGPIAARLPYPAWAPAILTSTDTGVGEFDGLSFRVDRRHARGLFFTLGYQLSKNMDNGSGDVEPNDTAFGWDHDADYGHSRYDHRHRGSMTFGYDVPAAGGRVARAFTGDWHVAGHVRFQSGQRFTVSVTPAQSLGSFVPARANFAPGRERDKGALAEPTPQRWFDPTAYTQPPAGFQGTAGRNTLVGPPFRRVDLAITRRIAIGSRRLDVRAEVFNALNTTNFGVPAANISSANAGTITEADEARSLQLSARVRW